MAKSVMDDYREPSGIMSEEEGLEGVYPEVMLAPVGRAVSGLLGLARGVSPTIARATAPKVTNSIYAKMPGRALTDTKYVQRNVWSPEEIQSIKDTGYMLPKSGGKAQKYFTATDEAPTSFSDTSSMLRIARDKVSPSKAVSRHDVEILGKDGTYSKLAKGGMVKVRGVGCAVKGHGKAMRKQAK